VSSETQVSSRRQCWSIQDQRSRCILTALLIHQRHTQTDDMRSQDRALHYRASRGKNQETPYQSVDPSESREAVFHHNLDRLQSLKLRAIFSEQMAHLRRIDLRFQPMSARPSVLAEIQRPCSLSRSRFHDHINRIHSFNGRMHAVAVHHACVVTVELTSPTAPLILSRSTAVACGRSTSKRRKDVHSDASCSRSYSSFSGKLSIMPQTSTSYLTQSVVKIQIEAK